VKVLFIYPNDYLSIGIPTGISVLSAILKENGYHVELFDFTFVKTGRIEIDETVGVSTYLPTDVTLEDLVANDPIISLRDAFLSKVAAFSPDIVLVSTMSGYFDVVIGLLKSVKLQCKTVFGGVHATLVPDEVVAKPEVDFVVVGEGEDALLELLHCLEYGGDYYGIKNLGFKKDGIPYINELRKYCEMDLWPTPDWGLFDSRHLFRPFMGKIYKGSFYT
jgi:hypothetical protein